MKSRLSQLAVIVLLMLVTVSAQAAEKKTITYEQIAKLTVVAESGNAEAQEMLGRIYMRGQETAGVSKNNNEALKWLGKAAEQNFPRAELELGLMYDEIAELRDYAVAHKWYQKAADHNLSLAQYKLGIFSRYGRFVPQNDAEAVKWWRLAAEQGEASAQANLGVAYHNGQGVNKDKVQEYLWFSLAAKQNFEDTKQAVDQLEKCMPPEQLTEAKRLVSEWKPKQETKQ